MGIVKRNVECPSCKKFIEIYMEEGTTLKDVVLKCKCGCKIKCIKQTRHITKWREIREEE